MASGQRGRPTTVAGTRKWFRELCEDTDRRKAVQKVIDDGIKQGNLQDYWKAVEHGFGRPPQALDVKVGPGEDGPLEFEVKFSDGDPTTAIPPAVSAPDVSGPSS